MNGLVFLLGGPDVGKTTLFKQVAQEFLSAGLRVGLIDSDVGQSTIGPPTTIGMVIAEEKLPDFSHPQAIYFVGNNNPVGHLLEVMVGSRRLVGKAVKAGVDVIVFDSSGLVQPPYGLALKYNKLELLRPQRIIAVEKKDELGPILSWLSCWDTEILHMRPSEKARARSASERTKYRQEKYRQYFEGAFLKTLDLNELCLYPPNFLSDRVDPIELLVGLQDDKWDTVAIGIIESLTDDTISIYAPYPPGVNIRGLVGGYIGLLRDGSEIGKIQPRQVL